MPDDYSPPLVQKARHSEVGAVQKCAIGEALEKQQAQGIRWNGRHNLPPPFPLWRARTSVNLGSFYERQLEVEDELRKKDLHWMQRISVVVLPSVKRSEIAHRGRTARRATSRVVELEPFFVKKESC
jgi:hypothetical protein